jgi:hypothetical protein
MSYIAAKEYLNQLQRDEPLKATVADLAASHIASTCPDWAKVRSTQQLLGSIVRIKSLMRPLSITMSNLHQRQENPCIF